MYHSEELVTKTEKRSRHARERANKKRKINEGLIFNQNKVYITRTPNNTKITQIQICPNKKML